MSERENIEYKRSWIELLNVFHYLEIQGDITESNIHQILQKFKVPINKKELKVKAKWKKYKEIFVYDLQDKPLFFIKELWQPRFFREILGLHIAIHFLDKELCPSNYMFGKWNKNKKKDIPILITSYVKGRDFKKKELENYYFALGRQWALHEVLSLYDVDWRHFIVQQGILIRIDFGRCFSNLDMEYQGFWDFQYKQLLKRNAFHEGIEHEREIINKNLSRNTGHLRYLIDKLYSLNGYKNFFIDFDIAEFIDKVRTYWEKYCSIDIF